jgi:FixJ family two-component response regulator
MSPRPASTPRPAVHIVEDDLSVRTALERLLISAGIRPRAFAGAELLLRAGCVRSGDCVVADVKMHGVTGLELQRRMRAEGLRVAFIFVTAHDSEEAREEAKREGAIAYFRKPVDDQALLDAIQWALSGPESSR